MRVSVSAMAIGLAASVIAAASAGAANMLSNPGFESSLADWNAGVGDPGAVNLWRDSTWGPDIHSGGKAAVFELKSTSTPAGGGSYWNLLGQVVPVTAGQSYNVDAWEKTAGINPDVRHGDSWIEAQFLDSNNNVLRQYQSAHITPNQGYTLMSVTDSGNLDLVAPAGAVNVRVQGVVQQTSGQLVAGDTEYYVFDDFSLTTVPEPALGTVVLAGASALSLRRKRTR